MIWPINNTIKYNVEYSMKNGLNEQSKWYFKRILIYINK